MRTRGLLLAGLLAVVASAPAWAGVGYSIHIESPAPDPTGGPIVIRGGLVVQALAEGGVGGGPEAAAFHLRPPDGGWSEAERVDMPAADEARFRSQEPRSTRPLTNGTYHLEVRAWGSVPAYDPGNRGTYAVRRVTVVVDNPPPVPHPAAVAAVRSVRIWWRDVPSAARQDFLGYRVWRSRGDGCPRNATRYRLVAQTQATSWASYSVRPGPACYRVSAVRASDLRETIDSPMSGPLAVTVPATAADAAALGTRPVVAIRTATVEPPEPRRPGDLGGFDEELPYRTAEIDPDDATEVTTVPTATNAGPLPQGGPASAAAGLLLLTGALHLRRFLSKGGTP